MVIIQYVYCTYLLHTIYLYLPDNPPLPLVGRPKAVVKSHSAAGQQYWPAVDEFNAEKLPSAIIDEDDEAAEGGDTVAEAD